MIDCVSLFSGCGGFDLGLESTGKFRSSLCVELDPEFHKTLLINQHKVFFPGISFLESARLCNEDAFSNETLKHIKNVRRANKDPWLITAGPPCQSFSSLGNKNGISDPRGNLTIRFFQLIEDIRPPIFIFENVPPLGQNPGAEVRKTIFGALERADYLYEARVVNMANYGCFTKRKRFIIIGSRIGKLNFPEPTHAESPGLFQKRWRASSEALAGMPCPYGEHDLTHHDPVTHTEAVRSRFESLRPGQYDNIRHRSKLDPNAPCATLVSGANDGYRQHIHWESRELTSRESARLHGFPDEFIFNGSKAIVSKQIANSVPVNFGGAIGHSLASEIERL